ncbi:MAG: hypothetical protein WCD44_02380 [Candidatus Babeliales bacterium]|jgi:hypothetical protein
MYFDKWMGLLFIILGIVILFFTLGDLLFRIAIGLFALGLINHGLRLRGFPPLQILIPMLFSKRWF